MRIIDTNTDNPKAPSQTLNTKNNIIKYISKLFFIKYKYKNKNNLNIKYSKLKRVINKCFRLET